MVPYSKQHVKVSLSHDLPERWTPHRVANTKLLYGETAGSASLIQYVNLPEYSLYFTRFESAAQELLSLVRDKPVYGLVVQLTGTLQASLPSSRRLRMLEWSFNFFYARVFDLELELRENGAQETFFLLVPEAFVVYFAKGNDMMLDFYKASKNHDTLLLLPQPKIAPIEMLERIWHLRAHGVQQLRLDYAQNMLSAFFASASGDPFTKIPDDEALVDRLYALKTYLQSNPDTNFTKDALMRQFSLNKYQFNLGFSAIYHFTPFGYLRYLASRRG